MIDSTLDDDQAQTNINIADSAQSIEEIFRLMNKYEEMIIDIQTETKLFRDENKELKDNLAVVIAENNRSKEASNNGIASFRSEYIIVADKIFTNLRNQLFLVNQEKEMYENLWRKTAMVLEREVPINSIVKIKNEHSLEIQKLKEEIITLTKTYDKSLRSSHVCQTHLKLLTEEVKKLLNDNNELSEKLSKVNSENKDLHNQIQELEKCFTESNELNREQMQKSSESFQKLQESVAVADEAMDEIEKLMTEKNQMKEECDWLSENISSIIESASKNIEKDFDRLKVEHEKKMEMLQRLLELEREKLKSSEQKFNVLNENFTAANREKKFLLQDLQAAMHTIVEAEMKFHEMKVNLEKSISDDSLQPELDKLMKIIENNQKSKQKWKKLIVDVTNKLEGKVKSLIEENQKLKMSKKSKKV